MFSSEALTADAATWLRLAGATIVLGGSVIAGHRAALLLSANVPVLSRLHPDLGAWAGLAVGALSIIL